MCCSRRCAEEEEALFPAPHLLLGPPAYPRDAVNMSGREQREQQPRRHRSQAQGGPAAAAWPLPAGSCLLAAGHHKGNAQRPGLQPSPPGAPERQHTQLLAFQGTASSLGGGRQSSAATAAAAPLRWGERSGRRPPRPPPRPDSNFARCSIEWALIPSCCMLRQPMLQGAPLAAEQDGAPCGNHQVGRVQGGASVVVTAPAALQSICSSASTALMRASPPSHSPPSSAC